MANGGQLLGSNLTGAIPLVPEPLPGAPVQMTEDERRQLREAQRVAAQPIPESALAIDVPKADAVQDSRLFETPQQERVRKKIEEQNAYTRRWGRANPALALTPVDFGVQPEAPDLTKLKKFQSRAQEAIDEDISEPIKQRGVGKMRAKREELRKARGDEPIDDAEKPEPKPDPFPGMKAVAGAETVTGIDVPEEGKVAAGETLAGLHDRLSQLSMDERDVIERRQVQNEIQNFVKTEYADQLVRIDEDYNKERNAIVKSNEVEKQRQVAEHKTKVDELSKQSITSLVSRMSTGKKILMGISIALGAIGRAMANPGGPNRAFQSVMRQINEDREDQKANIAGMERQIAISRTGIQDADAARANLVEDVETNYQATLKSMQANLQKSMLQAGMTEPEIAADEKIIALQKDSLDAEVKAATLIADKLSRTTQHQMLIAGNAKKGADNKITSAIRQAIRGDSDYKSYEKALGKTRAYSEMQDLMTTAIKTGNPKALQAAITQTMVIANGGILSDGERKSMAEQSGGYLQIVGDKLVGAWSGNVTDKTAQDFMGTLTGMRSAAENSARSLRESVDSRYNSARNPAGSVSPEVMGQMLPQLPGAVAPGAAADAGAAPAPAAVAGGSVFQSDDEVNQAIEFVRTNPNHTNAPAVTDMLRKEGYIR